MNRMPVAHPDVHRQRRAGRCQPLRQALGLPACELCDGRDAAEQLVVMRDLFDPRWRHVTATQDVGEERSDFIHPPRPAKGDEKDGIKGTHLSLSFSDPARQPPAVKFLALRPWLSPCPMPYALRPTAHAL